MDKQVKKRDIKLSDCDISKEKYNELRYFCMQYREKKRQLQSRYGLRASGYIGMSRGSSNGNPTEQTAMRNMMLQTDIELIEQTAVEADSEISQYLIKNVTDGMAYEYMDVPLSRTKFYDTRRYFFFLLAQKR